MRVLFPAFIIVCSTLYGKLPNVVILYADDMGVADVSYGDPAAKIQTPHLDRLASQGMTFTDGHSSSGICTPSRFALLTGQHHWRRFHGIVGAFGGTVFEPEDFTIAKMFKKKGYRSGCFGKWHLGWDFDAIRKPGAKKGDPRAESYDWTKPFPDGPLDQGFDYYFGDGTINFPPTAGSKGIASLPFHLSLSLSPAPCGGGSFRPGPMAESWNPYDILPTITQKLSSGLRSRKRSNPSSLTLLSIPLTIRSFQIKSSMENQRPVTTETSSSKPMLWSARY